MLFELLVSALTVAGITANIVEQAIEDNAEWIAIDSIVDDAAASLNESGLTDADFVE